MRVIRACPDAAGRIQDFSGQDEFQQRGSPHTRSLLWTVDAPVFEINTDAEICMDFDKFVTVSRSKVEEELIGLQTHHRIVRPARRYGEAGQHVGSPFRGPQ
jgi:hypothetical protein